MSEDKMNTINQLVLVAKQLESAAKKLEEIGMVGDDGPLRSTFYDIEIAQIAVAGTAGRLAVDDIHARSGIEKTDWND